MSGDLGSGGFCLGTLSLAGQRKLLVAGGRLYQEQPVNQQSLPINRADRYQTDDRDYAGCMRASVVPDKAPSLVA